MAGGRAGRRSPGAEAPGSPLDAAQLAPHRPFSIAELGVDYVALSGHKLYAPYGSGALIGRADWLRRPVDDGRVQLAHAGVEHALEPLRRHEVGDERLDHRSSATAMRAVGSWSSRAVTICSATASRTAGSLSMSVVTSAKPCELANVRQLHTDTMARFVSTTPATTSASVPRPSPLRRPPSTSTARSVRCGEHPTSQRRPGDSLERRHGPRVHLHQPQADPLLPARPHGAREHLDLLLPGRQDRGHRLQRRRQVEPAQDHGRPRRRLQRVGPPHARVHGRLPRPGAAARPGQGRQGQRHGRRRRGAVDHRPLQRGHGDVGRARRRLRQDRCPAGRARGQDRRGRRVEPRAQRRDRHGRPALPARRRRRRDAVRW